MAVTQGTDISVILNELRQTATSAYQDTVPIATMSNITDVGAAVIKAPQAIRNEFMENLYNKIGLTLVEYPVVNNHLSFLKKGTLPFGQTIEDIYVGLASAEPYITGMNDGDYPDPFAIRKVPHKSAFYHAILSRQYRLTRHISDLRKAFHGAPGMEAFIGGMMNAVTSREAYDDYRMTVALMARQIEEAAKVSATNMHKGRVKLITLFNAQAAPEDAVTAANAFNSMKFLQFFSNQLQKWAERMTYLREDLNIAGVPNLTSLDQQRIMMPGDIVVDFKTQLLAWAYNSGNLEIGGIDKIDAWYSIGANEAGAAVTPDDITTKATFTEDGSQCVGVIYDPGMAKIYNKEYIGSSQENGAGNYWNLFTSVEDIFAASPYKNFVYFTLD
jgi:hypothetical protein